MHDEQIIPLDDYDIIEIDETHQAVEISDATPIDDERDPEAGKAGYAIAWLLGVPLPILLIVYLISRC
jgi:hypothetical protein